MPLSTQSKTMKQPAQNRETPPIRMRADIASERDELLWHLDGMPLARLICRACFRQESPTLFLITPVDGLRPRTLSQ